MWINLWYYFFKKNLSNVCIFWVINKKKMAWKGAGSKWGHDSPKVCVHYLLSYRMLHIKGRREEWPNEQVHYFSSFPWKLQYHLQISFTLQFLFINLVPTIHPFIQRDTTCIPTFGPCRSNTNPKSHKSIANIRFGTMLITSKKSSPLKSPC